MKNFKKIISAIFCFLICFGVFASCSLFGGPKKLSTPVAGLNSFETELNWFTISNAEEYVIYLNDNELTTLKNKKDKAEQTYDFESDLTTFGKYKFRIKATSSKVTESALSNEVVFVYADKNLTLSTVEINEKFDATKAPKNIQLQENICSWDSVVNAGKYIITTYTNTNKVKNYEVDSNTLNFNLIDASNGEIVAFRVGAKIGEYVYFENQDLKYYNPKSSGEFTDNIYIFDGIIADHYIESIEELHNVVYYHFIYRDTDYEIRFNEECLIEIGKANRTGAYSQAVPATNAEVIDSINESFNYFLETCHYDTGKYNYNYASRISGSSYDYAVSLNFYNVKECDINLYSTDYGVVQYTQAKNESPYYETYKGGEARPNDYDDFASDKYFLTLEVETSEQLYWAVENNITPICKAGSRAEIIYNKAKETLREIIKEGMTDYDKALSIFDWICVNTNYDNANLSKIFSSDKTAYYTRFCAYYLEGVFIQKIAVCDGYSKAYSLLCNMEGLECIRITGNAGGGLHAWNKVKINGNYYVCDITWTEQQVGSSKEEYMFHKYFLVSDEFISNSHYAWSKRKKYFNYSTALKNYDYYSNTEFEYTNSNGDVKTIDLVVNSDEELKDLLYFFITADYKSSEVMFTYDYVTKLAKAGNHSIKLPSGIQDAMLMEGIKKQKFTTQMFNTVCMTEAFSYDGENDGFVVYLAFNQMIDEIEELKALTEYLINYSEVDANTLKKDYAILIDESILSSYTGETLSDKANAYLKDVNLDAYLILVDMEESEQMNFGHDTTVYKFKIVFKEGLKILNAPQFEIDNTTNVLSFSKVDGAESYDIFIDDKFEKNIVDDSEIVNINLNELMNKTGLFKIQIYAKSSQQNVLSNIYSDSKEFAKLAGEVTLSSSEFDIVYSSADTEFVINSGVELNNILTFNFNGVSDFIIAVSDGENMKFYTINSNIVDLYSLALDKASAIRIGVQNSLVTNQMIIYNNLTYYLGFEDKDYSNAYVFDGKINDHFINSIDELNNAVYYHFIERDDSYKIKFSDNAIAEIEEKQVLSGEKAVEKQIKEAFAYFCETCHYDYGKYKSDSFFSKAISEDKKEYEISVNFFGVAECNLELDHSNYTLNQATYYQTYYDTYKTSIASRDDSHKYYSDSYFLTTQVSTSEELYWAVENRVTPICKAGSRAEIIYNKAKSVLNKIIKDDMTDYEKALSIFDWICVNTVYDYINAENQYYYLGVYYTENCAYYLEGVFLQGIAVCDGYSKAYSLLCNMEGIECVRVAGTTGKDSLHAWNKVKIDGVFYGVDITWTELKNDGNEILTHRYFLVSDAFFGTGRTEWQARKDKFDNYKATKNYNYYKENENGFGNFNGELTSANLVANSDESMKNIMQLGILRGYKSLDFVLDYSYALAVKSQVEASINVSYGDDWRSAYCAHLKDLKLSSLLLNLYFDSSKITYALGSEGYVVALEFRLVIDKHIETVDGNETEILELKDTVEAYKNAYSIDKETKNKDIVLYFDMSLLKNLKGTNQEKLNEYLKSLNLDNIASLVATDKYEYLTLNLIKTKYLIVKLNLIEN